MEDAYRSFGACLQDLSIEMLITVQYVWGMMECVSVCAVYGGVRNMLQIFPGSFPQNRDFFGNTFPRFDPGSRYLKRGTRIFLEKGEGRSGSVPQGKFKIDGVISCNLVICIL
jgi:hypothetical protein